MGKMKRSRSYTQQVHHHHSTTTTTTTNCTDSSKTTTAFFPNLCRLSLNDIIKPTKLANLSSRSSSSLSTSSSSIDPSSPKISCIGQIKNRPSSSTTPSYKSSNNHHNLNSYTKLRKLFSTKNLIISAPPTSSSINTSKSCASNRNRNNAGVTVISNVDDKTNKLTTKPVVISIEELDPPLPVVKFRGDHQQLVNVVDLKKRRGIELKTLQIQPFQLLSTPTFDTSSSKTIDVKDVSISLQ